MLAPFNTSKELIVMQVEIVMKSKAVAFGDLSIYEFFIDDNAKDPALMVKVTKHAARSVHTLVAWYYHGDRPVIRATKIIAEV